MAKFKLAALEKKLLHYLGVAIDRFRLIAEGDRIMIGLSGGKDSLALVYLLHLLQRKAKINFMLKVVIVEQNWAGWQRSSLERWLQQQQYHYHFEPTEIAQIVMRRQAEKDRGGSAPRSPCMLCSRMRRGVLYRLMQEQGYNKLALGHHRDDLISSLLMSICYNGRISSMPPKLLNERRNAILIRPLVYCQESDLANYVRQLELPVQSSGCGVGDGGKRAQMKERLAVWSAENGKIPSNILHAMEDVRLSQLMDRSQFDFGRLEDQFIGGDIN